MKLRVSAALVVAAVVLAAPVAGSAHFILQQPKSALEENQLGDPQKLGPCGGTTANPGKPTGTVTPVTGGDMLHVQVKETIYHPGHFRLALTSVEKPSLSDDGLPGDVLAALKDDKPSPALSAYYRSIAPELAGLREQIGKLESEEKAIRAAFPQTLVTVSMAQPRMVRVLPRGNWLDDSGEQVQPGTPAFLADPGVKDRLVEDGSLRRFVNVYLNDEDVRFIGGLDAEVSDGDQVVVLPAVAGG